MADSRDLVSLKFQILQQILYLMVILTYIEIQKISRNVDNPTSSELS